VTTTGVGALTPSEDRVARMAMEGPTNREIAQALFVSEKTVEMHLSNAYQKLGIRSRSQLATALGEEQSLRSAQGRGTAAPRSRQPGDGRG
jgi:DNA-binding NarL/FixJ family response regulator